MIVKDLIAYLQAQDPEAVAGIETWDGDYTVFRDISFPVSQVPGFVTLAQGGSVL